MKSSSIIVSVIAGAVILLAAWIFGSAYRYKFKSTQTITVNGNAKKDFDSFVQACLLRTKHKYFFILR